LLASRQSIGAIERSVGESDAIQTFHGQAMVADRQREKAAQGAMVAKPSREDIVQDRYAADQLVLLENESGATAMLA
jgi:hypothetical protein